jgi:hypothetical protein
MTMTHMEARAELRVLIKARASWDRARHLWACGVIGDAAFNRFERLWAWSTATEHPLTRHASLERWTSRRDRIRNALRAIGA